MFKRDSGSSWLWAGNVNQYFKYYLLCIRTFLEATGAGQENYIKYIQSVYYRNTFRTHDILLPNVGHNEDT